MDDLGLASVRARSLRQAGAHASTELEIISDAEARWRRAREAVEVAEAARKDRDRRWRAYVDACKAQAEKHRQHVVERLAKSNEITVATIINETALFYNKRPDHIISGWRSQKIMKARRVAMYLSRTMARKSFPELGRLFGGRDHSTIIHACQKIEEQIREERGKAREVATLRKRLRRT